MNDQTLGMSRQLLSSQEQLVDVPLERTSSAEVRQRTAAATPRLLSLQALRAVAALLVVMFHTEAMVTNKFGVTPFYGFFLGGSRGVDLFFVLSGFIITFIHADDWGKPNRLLSYCYNRVTRIYPLLWITTAFAIPFFALGFGTHTGAQLSFSNAFTTAMLIPQVSIPLLPVTWSLKYELYFYIIFAVVIVRPRIGASLLLGWQATAIVLAVLGISSKTELWDFFINPNCLEFAAGMLCALFVMKTSYWASFTKTFQLSILIVASIAFATGMLFRSYQLEFFLTFQAILLFATSAAAVVGSLVMLESSGHISVPRWLIFLGDASYAIYLVHYWVISRVIVLAPKVHVSWMADIVAIMVAGLAVAIGVGAHKAIDQPIQSYLRRVKPRILMSAAKSH